MLRFWHNYFLNFLLFISNLRLLFLFVSNFVMLRPVSPLRRAKIVWYRAIAELGARSLSLHGFMGAVFVFRVRFFDELVEDIGWWDLTCE